MDNDRVEYDFEDPAYGWEPEPAYPTDPPIAWGELIDTLLGFYARAQQVDTQRTLLKAVQDVAAQLLSASTDDLDALDKGQA